MSYSAQELFNDWYTHGVKHEASPSELSNRKSSINRVLAYTDVNIWLVLVKLFHGLTTEDSEEIKFLVNEIRKDDDSFPLKNNYNALRTIAGCIIAQKIEKNEGSGLSNVLSLSLLTIYFGNRTAEIPINDVTLLAYNSWVSSCKKTREVGNLDADIEFYDLIANDIDLVDDTNGNSYASVTNFNANNVKLKLHLSNLSSDTNNLIESLEVLPNIINNINSRLNLLAEESNIFWWLYNSFSRDLDSSFKKLGLAAMCIVAPKELADLTIVLPGLNNNKPLFYKALQYFEDDPKFSKTTFSSAIESTVTFKNWVSTFASEIPTVLEEITPCLYALKCYIDSDYEEGWKLIFKKKGKIKPDFLINPITFSQQLYLEILLIRVFKTL